jgi:hypothetical protein
MATLAVFIALGGGAYAVVSVPDNSVGTRQLRNSAVAHSKIENNAVTSSKVKDGSLLGVDFKAGQLPAGPAGPKGDQGPPGSKGDPCSPGDAACRGPQGPGAAALSFDQAPDPVLPSGFESTAVHDLITVDGVDFFAHCADVEEPHIYVHGGLAIRPAGAGTLSTAFADWNGAGTQVDTARQPVDAGQEATVFQDVDTSLSQTALPLSVNGQLVFRGDDGKVLTAVLHAQAFAGTCEIHGTVTPAG